MDTKIIRGITNDNDFLINSKGVLLCRWWEHRESGYFTFNLGKTDYNFIWDEKATYSLMQKGRSAVPWDTLKQSQPFFGQIQTAGGKNNTSSFPAERKVDPRTVTVPPDYPQNQIYREVVAQHYDAIRKDDDFIGEVLQGLRDAGLEENTIVVDSWDDFVSAFEDGKSSFVYAHWDGTIETELAIKEATKATLRCVPLEGQGPAVEPGTCIKTGEPSAQRVLFAKNY